MAFAVDPDRPLGRALRSVGKALAAAARDDLLLVGEDPVAAVHDARREIRSARAVIKLVRISVGPKEYARQNGALRRAGRLLSSHRDAHVLGSAFNRLLGHDASLEDENTPRLRALLTAVGEGSGQALQLAAAAALAEVDAFDEGIARWPRKGRVVEINVATGFEQTLRRVRRATELAADEPTADALHTLRKRAKDAREQLRTLMPLAPKRYGKLERRYTALCSLLGEGCDQVVLALACERLGTQHAELAPTIERVRDAALARFERVGVAALAEARTLTERSPRKIAGRLLAR